MNETQKQLLNFLYQSEGLKRLLRHSWLSNGRRESVAEHTWRMALMAILFSPYLKKKINLQKVLKMVLVHDLGEIYSKDHWAWKTRPNNADKLELKALTKLVKVLPNNLSKEVLDLYKEYEANKTLEAHFAKSLDKLEVLIQHVQSDIKTQTRKELKFNLWYGDKFCEFDPFTKEFRKLLKDEFLKYYRKNKVDKKLYL